MTPVIIQFFVNLYKRFFSSKPKFFAKLQLGAFIIGGLSSIILYLESHKIHLPGWVSVIGNLHVIIGSVIALIVAQLPRNEE